MPEFFSGWGGGVTSNSCPFSRFSIFLLFFQVNDVFVSGIVLSWYIVR